MRTLRVDSRLAGHRLHPVGTHKNTVYLRSSNRDVIEIWSLNTLFPDSWKCIFSMPVDELFYVFPAFSYEDNRIFVLIVAVFKGEHDGRAALFELDRHTLEIKEYGLDLSIETDFSAIPFETSSLAFGANGLHIFDRAIVMGPIPYWTFEIIEDKFRVHRKDVEDVSAAKCNRFPIAVNSGCRLFARFMDDNRLLVSSSADGFWLEYLPSPDTKINLSELGSRSIRETFGRSGHRAGAVQSPLTIYCDGGRILAKVTHCHKHHFFKIELDHEKREFRCIPAGDAFFTGNTDLMFYGIVAESSFVLVGISSIAVVSTKPPSLAESALWTMQKKATNSDEVESCRGGFDLIQLAKICGFAVAQSFAV